MEQLPLKVIDLSHDDEGTAISDATSAYGAPPGRNGKRSYKQVTQGNRGSTQRTSQASQMSGVTAAPTQATTAFDEKFNTAMETFDKQAKIMQDKQQEIATFREQTETRFKDLEDKLSKLLDVVSTANVNQGAMQETLKEQQSQLATITEMLVRLTTDKVERDDVSLSSDTNPNSSKKPRATPAEHTQATGTAEDSMDLDGNQGSCCS